jgi:hypothetical protein
MANWKGLASLVSQLKAERMNLVAQLKNMDMTLSALGKLKNKGFTTEPKRNLSPAARRKISAAQKARWARRSANPQSSAVRPKPILSAAARKKIAAAQRERWRLWKANQKKVA